MRNGKYIAVALFLFSGFGALGEEVRNDYPPGSGIPEEVWKAPFMEIDEFLEKYEIPRSGSTEADLPDVFEKRKAFDEKFFGLVVDNQKFAVISRPDVSEPNFWTEYYLQDISGRTIRCIIWVVESEQKSLELYPWRYRNMVMPKAYWLIFSERIPWGTFCRRIMSERGNLIDFVNGGFGIWMTLNCKKPVDLLPVGKELDALFRGNAEFLPENDPELVAIREAYREACENKKREWEEELERRRKAERLEKLRERLAQGLPLDRDHDYKNLSTRLDLLKNNLKPTCVPVVGQDSDAWKKLSLKNVQPLFKKYKFKEVVRRSHADVVSLNFHVWRNDDEIKRVKPEGIFYDVDIIHSKDFSDAWDWALFFRLKYSEDTEQRARLTMKQLAGATHQNAFPGLGDLNISWRGRMNSSFYPEEKSAESLIIFIRGTTTVCVRSCYTDTSALPLARLLDKQLLEGDASQPDEYYFPEIF